MGNDTKKSGEQLGEGNYTASRNFRESEEKFVKENKERIPGLGKDAEKALDGAEGEALKKAEEKAKSHSHAKGQ